jgi:hypothetical protein
MRILLGQRSPGMEYAQLSLINGLTELEVIHSLLIPLQAVEATADIVVASSDVRSVLPQRQFTDLTGH